MMFCSISRLALFLVTMVCFPITLMGQDDAASIVGQAFIHVEVRSGWDHDIILATSYLGEGFDAILVADGDTLRTKSDRAEGYGRFSFSGIVAKQVTLCIKPDKRSSVQPFTASFELMPGENILLIPLQGPDYPEESMLQMSKKPIVTTDWDSWVYHYPTDLGGLGEKGFVMTNLKDVPGVEYVYNKRNGERTISAPQKVVRMTEVNGAYIFGQTPSVSP